MQIPKTVKVGGLTYTVTIVDDVGDGAVGKINYPKQTIKIEKASEDFMILTFLHEILHAMNAEVNEIHTEFMAQALMQFIKDNPDCFKGGDLSGRKKSSSNKSVQPRKRTSGSQASRVHVPRAREGCMEKVS